MAKLDTTGIIKKIGIDCETNKTQISLILDTRRLDIIEQLKKDGKLNLELKKYRKKRSLNANAYFWELLSELCELAEVDTVEEYKRRVKELGIFRQFKIETRNFRTFEKMWTAQGIAWFCEIVDTTYIGETEFKIINAYYGSSSYNSKQMARLIDGVVQDCKIYGIETKTEAEINSLLEEWDKYKINNRRK